MHNTPTLWKVTTISGFAGGHGDHSKAHVTLQIDTEANTVEEVRALVESLPVLRQQRDELYGVLNAVRVVLKFNHATCQENLLNLLPRMDEALGHSEAE